jgi:Winged helix domain
VSRAPESPLAQLGIVIDTVRERHGGRFPGDHARYVLRSRIVIIDNRDVGA